MDFPRISDPSTTGAGIIIIKGNVISAEVVNRAHYCRTRGRYARGRYSRSNLATGATILNLYRRETRGKRDASHVTVYMSLFEVSCTMLNLRCQRVSHYLARAGSLTCIMSCKVTSLPQPVIRRERVSRRETVIAFRDRKAATHILHFILLLFAARSYAQVKQR